MASLDFDFETDDHDSDVVTLYEPNAMSPEPRPLDALGAMVITRLSNRDQWVIAPEQE